jgi:hypothetical protein
MLDQTLVARAAALLKIRVSRSPAVDRQIFAEIVAGSHRLEGIDTSPEAILDAADSMSDRTHTAIPQLRPTSGPKRGPG